MPYLKNGKGLTDDVQGLTKFLGRTSSRNEKIVNAVNIYSAVNSCYCHR